MGTGSQGAGRMTVRATLQWRQRCRNRETFGASGHVDRKVRVRVRRDADVEGFGCRPLTGVRHAPAAGVRKPPAAGAGRHRDAAHPARRIAHRRDGCARLLGTLHIGHKQRLRSNIEAALDQYGVVPGGPNDRCGGPAAINCLELPATLRSEAWIELNRWRGSSFRRVTRPHISLWIPGSRPETEPRNDPLIARAGRDAAVACAFAGRISLLAGNLAGNL
jgi:hypothetical protein